MKGRSTLDHRTITQIQRALESARVQLEASMWTAVNERRLSEVGRTGDMTAQASVTLDDEIQVVLVDRRSRQVAQIEAALERLACGEYGVCGSCGEFIGLRRLRALPFAHRCSACQAEAELAERRAASGMPERTAIAAG